MHRHSLKVVAATTVAILLAASLTASAKQRLELVVCADADNLPFSNKKSEGFENKIVRLIAADLGATVRYSWNNGPRGFRPRQLLSGSCNLVMGVPDGLPGIAVTQPYYTSTYVFVTARNRNLDLQSFDDPALRNLKIGLQAIGAKGANTPPANALARRGLADNIVGYSTWDGKNGQGNIVDAVVAGEVDTALVWGPIAGYFAKRHGNKLALAAVSPDPQQPMLAFSYAISLGVNKDDDALKAKLQKALEHKQAAIEAILKDYGVPLLDNATKAALMQAR